MIIYASLTPSLDLISVIIDAIVLLTGKFDRNVAYRAALADTGDEEPESLNIVEAIILITVPTIGGKI